MTQHYFEHPLVKLHYYRFGKGEQKMLCFHGYGMHGKQFKLLEGTALAAKYTFYGFDLFFHKETILQHQSLQAIKKGISKKDFARLISSFCKAEKISRFSVMGYSMGTHYATVIAEEMANSIDEYIAVSPSCLNPGVLIKFFSKNSIGNKILEKLSLSDTALLNMLNWVHRLGFVDKVGYDILYKEIGTPQLRFNFYASFTYLRFFETDAPALIKALNSEKVKGVFIFGKRDRMFPPGIGKKLLARLKQKEIIILDENHEMINQNFVSALSAALL